jgi:hypothetical protein
MCEAQAIITKEKLALNAIFSLIKAELDEAYRGM